MQKKEGRRNICEHDTEESHKYILKEEAAEENI